MCMSAAVLVPLPAAAELLGRLAGPVFISVSTARSTCVDKHTYTQHMCGVYMRTHQQVLVEPEGVRGVGAGWLAVRQAAT